MQLTVSALGAIALLPSLALAAPAALGHEESSADLLVSRALPASVQTCLNKYPLEKSYPDSSTYNSYSQAENENLHYAPAAFALPSSAAGAADVVKCVAAQKGGVKMAVRGGGHSYEAYSLGGADNHLVLDMRKFTNITVDSAAKTATIGAGVRLGDLAKTLADSGFALPHGTCAYVGVGGHSLGGGYGYSSRPWGYLVDHIVSMQVVQADGSIVTASSTQNTDLWYALRGAGQNNYGVVLSFTYALETAPTSTVDFTYGWKSNSDCVEALLALQTLSSTSNSSAALPKNMTAELLWITENAAQGGPACTIGGQHIGATLAQHQAAFQKLRDITKQNGVDIDDSQTQVNVYSSWADALKDPNVMGSFDVSDPASARDPYYAKSIVQPLSAPYTRAVATTLMNKLNNYSTTDGTGNSISFAGFGPLSQTNAPSVSASSFVHRDTLFLSQIYSYGQTTQLVRTQMQDLVQTAHTTAPNASWGAYINYVDRNQTSWGTAYYGSAVSQLKSIKKTMDPYNIFDYAQGIANA